MSGKQRVNILLVDDQPGKLLTYEAVLKDLDETLIKASSASEALGLLLKHDFAVVLVDVCMPELDGYQLAAMMRDHPRFEKTPIIFISAIYLSELDHLRGYETGAVDYVPVPVVPEILRAKVKVFVELHRKTLELERLNRELEDRVASRTAELLSSNERLKQSEERLRMASIAAEFGTYECDLKLRRIDCSPQMKRLLGYDGAGDLSIAEFLGLVYPGDRGGVRRSMLSFEETGANGLERQDGRHEVEFRVPLSDGSLRWLLDRGQAFFEEGNPAPVRIIGVVMDVTERKQTEERQLLLMAELDHRVKNVLANIGAIARLSSKRNATVDGFVAALEARIQAVAAAHSSLRRDSWIGVNLKNFAGAILAPFADPDGGNVIFEGDTVILYPKAAQSLALVLHELATNAAKYGALSTPEGKVLISCRHIPQKGDGIIRLAWRETGGPRVEAPSAAGFGTTVLKMAAAELDANLSCDFHAEGVSIVFEGKIGQAGKIGHTHSSQGQPIPSAILAPHEPSMRKYRILIVEDEPAVALQVKSDLEAAGHMVVALASTVMQGIQFAARSEFDVAFLDIRLGDELSTPVAENLLKRGIPFAFGTGFEDETILPQHLRAVPRLLKPYRSGSVTKLIGSLTPAS